MIKLIALTVTLAAFSVGSSFAGTCGGGSCDKKKEDNKKEKPEAVQVINL